MDTHVTEVVAEAFLEERARLRLERATVRGNDLTP
jgi:hypothetical protein